MTTGDCSFRDEPCVARWARVFHPLDAPSSLHQVLLEDHADCSELLQRGLKQLSEVAAVLANLRTEHDTLTASIAAENEKGDLLLNILGSLLQEVWAGVVRWLWGARCFIWCTLH